MKDIEDNFSMGAGSKLGLEVERGGIVASDAMLYFSFTAFLPLSLSNRHSFFSTTSSTTTTTKTLAGEKGSSTSSSYQSKKKKKLPL